MNIKEELAKEPIPPFVREIQEGVLEIVDENGVSVFSTHCSDCGKLFFFSNLHLLYYLVVCQACKEIRNTPQMEERMEILEPSAHNERVTMECKNYSLCGNSMVRSQRYSKNPTCFPCKREAQRIRERAYA